MRGGGGLEEGRRPESVIGSKRRGAHGRGVHTLGLVGDLPSYYAWATTGNFTRGGGWEWELGGNECR